MRNVDVLINVTLNICELFGWVRWITLKDDLVVVAALLHFAEIKGFVDVVRHWHSELWQSLFKVWMERSWVDH